MAKGRHGRREKAKKSVKGDDGPQEAAEQARTGPLFVEPGHDGESGVDVAAAAEGGHRSPAALMTLLFDDRHAQHKAMARIEAFYESSESSERRYITLEEASQRRLCANYEAFNFPISVVHEWLACMCQAHSADAKDAEKSEEEAPVTPFWSAHTNDEEGQLLSHLENRGCLLDGAADVAQTSVEGPLPAASAPLYVVSCLRAQALSSLAHERLHFLYFISPDYRRLVQRHFDSLAKKTRKVIETDLQMRKYAQHVWPDEFQAYVSLDPAEFGGKTTEECTPIRTELCAFQRSLWQTLLATA